MKLKIKLNAIYLKLYFLFKNKLLFKDGYGLKYYLYKNNRPNSSLNLGVRTDDTTVLYTIDKILSSTKLTTSDEIHCIDVGGYIGVVTLMMSQILEKNKRKWKVHTFEPFKETFLKLKENINLHPYKKKILLNEMAVSNIPGSSFLTAYKDSPGETHLKNSKFKTNKQSTTLNNVKVITLGDYINTNSIKHVCICKVDTEGSDYYVIKGLNEYIEKNFIDYFIFEYQLTTYEQIKDILSKNGYTIYHMIRNENLLINSIEKYPKNCKSLLNCIAVSSEHNINFIKKFNLE